MNESGLDLRRAHLAVEAHPLFSQLAPRLDLHLPAQIPEERAGLMRLVRTVVNLELGAHPDIVKLATRLRPFQATLVPERSQEITTEGGLALHGGRRDARVATPRG